MLDWTAKYNYNFPTSIRFGKDVSHEIGTHLKDLGFKKAFMVSDPGLTKLPVFQKVVDLIAKEGIKVTVFSEISKNPVKSNVLAGVASYQSSGSDCVIGFGGGASMDVARAIVLKVNHPLDLFDYDDAIGGDRFVTNEVPYFITVPTTAGTGSEVGRSTVISDDVTHAKKILFSPKLLARKVFVDPMLTMDLPGFITAATGMDALTHNVEAYLSKGFSPMCDGIALEGIRLISQSLERAVHSPDLESRSKMIMASLMGATAFQKGLGVVHSLAHPLSTVIDMHHGLANAIMIPHGLQFNVDHESSNEKYKNMAQACDLSDTTAKGFIHYVLKLNEKIGIPARLGSQKVGHEHLERLSELAINDPCHQSNPKKVSREDFMQMYKGAI
jgi:alcohol dehydrogenase class IV